MVTDKSTDKVSKDEDGSAEKKTLHVAKPMGQVNMPTIICGVGAAVLAIALDLMKRYDGLTLSIQNLYKGKPFYLENLDAWHCSLNWVIALVLSVLMAYVVLDTSGKAKRVLIGLVSLILVAMFSPLLMLWGVFCVPVVVFVAVLFAWLFSFVYAGQHTMPCDVGRHVKLKKNKRKKKTDSLKKSNVVEELEKAEEEEIGFKPTEK